MVSWRMIGFPGAYASYYDLVDQHGIKIDRPPLAGQYAPYIAFELRMWQRGYRKNSPDGMAVVARALDEREIAAVAAYYQQARGAGALPASQ
jgi:cytochrome c553